MKSPYWKNVGKRLLSLGKVVAETATTAAVDYALISSIEKACDLIDTRLKKMYLQTAINSSITLFLNILGILICVYNPFGITVSRYAGACFFISAIIFFIVRMVLYIKNYGKISFQISKNIIQEKSVSRGIRNVILQKFPIVSLAYAEITIASNYITALEKVPKLEDLVKHFIKTFWKKIALYFAIVATYTIVVFWILKPLILKQAADLTWYEIYLYPVFHIIDTIRGN